MTWEVVLWVQLLEGAVVGKHPEQGDLGAGNWNLEETGRRASVCGSAFVNEGNFSIAALTFHGLVRNRGQRVSELRLCWNLNKVPAATGFAVMSSMRFTKLERPSTKVSLSSLGGILFGVTVYVESMFRLIQTTFNGHGHPQPETDLPFQVS